MSRPCAISTHASHAPHGSAVGPFTQLSAFARIRAVVVLPRAARTGKHERVGDAAAGDGVAQRPRHRLLADDLVEPLRTPLARENLVRHSVEVKFEVESVK